MKNLIHAFATYALMKTYKFTIMATLLKNINQQYEPEYCRDNSHTNIWIINYATELSVM